ncbi:Gfo/Idh/MocA family protein [Paenibacillus nasutitermitis]|uniref:Dehydrogenase n=1 Tax=Paenibacillus nasutitermitis TaxID=1652958 RepID=A0A917E181_9BACL|nr:Gfo/Idh/MocA family oxidoreductase [Paenibacillus nasutitermitis]GGD87726.1 dehydrogenase [Paenibacillus nasutitermitis]
MSKTLKLGMIGLDTSHVSAFAALLNDPDHPYHVAGGRIEVAYPGIPSQDFELSYSRIGKYTEELSGKYGVAILESAEAVAEQSDAVLLVSVDGRVHLDLFKRIVSFGKPVFIDKPLAVSSREAEEIFALARQYKVPLMSCSSLRYAEALTEELSGAKDDDKILGADCYGPMTIESALPDFFWYGIHSVEILYRIMGKGCVSLSVTTNEDYDVITGTWEDGRIGVVRGNRKGNNQFGALIHRSKTNRLVEAGAHPKPTYAGMLERIMSMFHSGQSDIDPAETLEIIRFLECANQSRRSGATVKL